MDLLSQMTVSGVLSTVAVGFVVGLLARVLKPGDDDMGLIMTTVIGILGSVLATLVGKQMGWQASNHWIGWGASVVGSIVLLYLYSLIFRRNKRVI